MRALAKDLGLALGNGDAPQLAVLSNEGKLTATYPLRLGKDRKLDPQPLGAFLLQYKLPTRDAEVMLSDGLAQATAEQKRVFLIMSASWCGPCRMLARFLTANKAELGRHYVFVKLDVSRDTHAQALLERYQGKNASSGVPWYVILDPTGKPLVTSNAKEIEEEYGTTNVGFPSSKEGIDHFLKMLRQNRAGSLRTGSHRLASGAREKAMSRWDGCQPGAARTAWLRRLPRIAVQALLLDSACRSRWSGHLPRTASASRADRTV